MRLKDPNEFKDNKGQEIDKTYIKNLSASGKTITYTKGDGSTGTITTQDTDTKVTNTLATTTKAYITGTTSASTNTGTQIFDTGVYLDTTAGTLTATTFKGTLSGNASTATTLQTARTINGTSFNGGANITTALWGTARNITIGNTTKSVNGSGNVAWTLSEIGAAAASHTHSYLPLSGGNLTGTLGIGNKYDLSPAYNYSNGYLLEIGAAKTSTMVTIHIIGNSYNSSSIPVSSLFQFYDYGDGGIIQASGINQGLQLGQMKVYRYNNKLYAFIQQTTSYQTLSFQIVTNKSGLSPVLKNEAMPSSGYTDLITITPKNISLSDHTHNYAGSSSAGGAATTALACSGNSATATKATQDSAGQQINKTYIKGLSVSGKTITYTKGDGTTGTITTQDTNTTYSTGTASALGLTKLYTGTGTATDGTMTQSAINTALNGKASSSHTHNSITNQDTRNVNTTPTQMPLGLSVHLKSNSTDGLNDGGTYHSTLMIKGWNDASGGPWSQMAVTANNNLYFRSSNNDTWNAWKKVSLDGHTHNYAAASHGNHVPATQTADARKFLRNDNTWQSLPTASTSATGIVQLNDATNSTSTTQAATANAVKKAYDRAEQAFQSGNNVKQQLVDTLIAKGSENVSTSNSWEEIIEMINGSNIDLATPVFTVEFIAGVPYGFVLRGDGYYESVNKGVQSSYAMCKVVTPPGKSGYYYMDCINYGENNYDYGIISRLNQVLSMDNSAAEGTSPAVLHSFYNSSSPSIQTISLGQLPDGGFFYVKYRKDNITDEWNDSLRFKVRLSDKDEGGGENLPSGEIVIFDGFRHANEIGGGYKHIESSYASNHTIENGEFKIYSQGSAGSIETIYAKQAINLTNYTSLEFTGMSSTSNSSNYTAHMGFYANGDSTRKLVAYASFNRSTFRTTSINVNSLNGEYVLAIQIQLESVSSSVNVCIRDITLK